jgi:hypothetical protein
MSQSRERSKDMQSKYYSVRLEEKVPQKRQEVSRSIISTEETRIVTELIIKQKTVSN